jgi:hypothetical protein
MVSMPLEASFTAFPLVPAAAIPTGISALPLLLIIFQRCAVESAYNKSTPDTPDGAEDSVACTCVPTRIPSLVNRLMPTLAVGIIPNPTGQKSVCPPAAVQKKQEYMALVESQFNHDRYACACKFGLPPLPDADVNV